MGIDWLDLLACPRDGSDLEGDPAREVGCLRCGKAWRAEDGVLRFLRGVATHEQVVRDALSDTYDDDLPALSDTVEVPLGLKALGVRPGDRVAEIGAGTGRFTRGFAAKASATVAVDYSAESLLRLREKLPADVRPRVLLVQADAAATPFKPGTFDRSAAFNMLQHLPTAEQRLEVVRRGANAVRPGGPFVLTAYHWSRHKQAVAARGEGDYACKEGLHDNGVFYRNFDEAELRALFAEAGLAVDRVQGLIVGFRGARLLGPLLAPLNRLIASTRWCVARSHYILVRGVRPSVPAPLEARSADEAIRS
ncbi:MAG: class I SAM-dependent methyltransferase [Gemmataceae bacterium]|nr:class I SAM-dependent methyltransferase [Gemmataceae bacterium]